MKLDMELTLAVEAGVQQDGSPVVSLVLGIPGVPTGDGSIRVDLDMEKAGDLAGAINTGIGHAMQKHGEWVANPPSCPTGQCVMSQEDLDAAAKELEQYAKDHPEEAANTVC